MATETRQLSMHPQMLFDVIKRQAGTLTKALLEGIMNGVDAGATEIHISLAAKSVIIKDNGRGMTDKQTILDFWEIFGQPPQKTEQKTYGQFRMGRGQLFAFGKNVWTTGKFLMEIDIQNNGLKYDLSELDSNAPGCHIAIQLYQELLPSDKATIERELATAVKYVPAKIYFNNELLTVDVDTVEWDQETDEAHIKLKDTGNLYIYNLGVLVCSHPCHIYGCGGEVVSKQQLKVNFARNEVMSDCPIWRRIKPIVNQRADTRLTRNKPLTDDGRQRLIDKMKAGELDEATACKAKVLTDVNGRHWSLDQLQPYNWNRACTIAPAGDARGDAIMQHRLAFVFSNILLERFAVKNLVMLLKVIDRVSPQFSNGFVAKDFAELTAATNANCELVPDADWGVSERLVIGVLNGALYRFRAPHGESYGRYKVVLGLAECVDSWTDASTFIAISRKTIEQHGIGIGSWIRYLHMLIENLCTETANHAVQSNSPEFYEACHDMARQNLHDALEYCITQFPRAVEQMDRKLTKQQLRDADRVEQHNRGTSRALELVPAT